MAEEFPVYAYEHTYLNRKDVDGPPVYVIRFKHWEMPPENFSTVLFQIVAAIIVCFGGLAGVFVVLAWTQETGIGWFVPLLLWIGLVWYCVKKLMPPWQYKRAIEIDTGEDLMRLYRNGKWEQDYPLSHFTNFTIEPHPQAEHARENRMLQGKKQYSYEEKQHCLFGYYGPGGGSKVLLVTRYEWPNKGTLREVRAAIIWAMGEGREAREQPEAPRQRGMKPPLD